MKDERKEILKNNDYINKVSDGEVKNEKRLMLFLSYDITDSTRLKVIYHEKWPQIIDVLVRTKFQYMNYWKFNGDEILYKRSIRSLDFMCRIIEEAYSHMRKINTKLTKIINNINVKATIWLALSESDSLHYINNFSFAFEDEVDFVGKNIDEGFRLTKCSSMNKIAIDPKIVYILLDTYDFFRHPNHRNTSVRFYKSKNDCDFEAIERTLNDVIFKLHLVGYSKCKGVWDDNPYPVYWYYDNTQNAEIRYDEFLNEQHLWQKNILAINKESSALSEYNNLDKIFEQMNVKKEIDEIYNLLTATGDVTVSATGKANLYYMVVCINPKTNKVMIAKRSCKRKHLKNVWDFGNVKYQNVNMKDTIEKEYQNTFGIDIELVLDENRGNNLKPFGYCTIYRNCKPHNSILCHAKISNPSNLDDEELIEYIMHNKNDNYNEIRFVDTNDISNFKSLSIDDIRLDSEYAELGVNEPFEENTCIMYFLDSIGGATHQ